MSEWYFHPVGDYWLVAAILIGLVGVMWAAGPPAARLSRWKRAVLMVLRVVVLLLFSCALLRPTLVHSTTRSQPSTLVLLLDASRSMRVVDAFGGKSRWDALRATINDVLPALRTLGSNVEVKIYTFDSQLHSSRLGPSDLDLPAQPVGRQTAIGAALEEMLRREAGKRLAGVVVLGDGAQRALAPRDLPPQVPARRLADLGFPLYTLTFGQGTGLRQSRDVALRDLNVNQSVFVKNQLTAVGNARIEGYGSQSIPVELLMENAKGKMEIVASDVAKASPAGEPIPLRLTYIPETPGEYKVTVRLARQPGELVTTNNELSTFVTVLKGGINVLYLESALRTEQKFIRRALDRSPDIKVVYQRLLPGDVEAPRRLSELFGPGRFDAYVIGDLDSSLLTAPELSALAAAVERGAGLLMLGGFHSFGAGGYARTPLADLLPVEMDPLERQGFDEKIRSDLHWPGPLRMQPSRPLGINHYLMSLSTRGAEVWEKLPPLDGANRFIGPKPSAQVLAESEAGAPLLLVHEAGGRVMAFAGDSTWRWVLHGFQSTHRRFWRQVVLWLTRKDQIEQGSVWLKLAERRFAPGMRVDFTAGVQAAEGQDVSGASITAEVRLPGGSTQSVAVSAEGSQARGAFDQTLSPGDYMLTVRASAGGKSLGTAKARFLVYEQDLELDNPAADPTLLSSLAKLTEASGGQSLAPEELPELIDRIKHQKRELEVQTQVKQTPWDTWPFMLAFITVISFEWFLRKRWGLV